MNWLFILALILAWPTFGLSILIWLFLLFLKAKDKTRKIDIMREKRTVLDPLFRERFDEFFLSLDLPLASGATISKEEASHCGRHIVNFIAYNHEETELLIKGLKRWEDGTGSALCDPIRAAQIESLLQKAEVHLVAYRAMEAISINNRNLRSFQKISLPVLRERMAVIEEDLHY